MQVCMSVSYTHIGMPRHIHVYIQTFIYTYVHACIHTYVHKYIHTYIHACMHTYRKAALRPAKQLSLHIPTVMLMGLQLIKHKKKEPTGGLSLRQMVCMYDMYTYQTWKVQKLTQQPRDTTPWHGPMTRLRDTTPWHMTNKVDTGVFKTIQGQFPAFQRFSSSKPVLKTVESPFSDFQWCCKRE